MTTPTPIYKLPLNGASADGPYEPFYVPHFEVKINGRELPDDVVRDVIQVTYRDSIDQIDSFDLLISNYESDFSQPHASLPDHYLRAKYEPYSRAEYDGLFDPGLQIELRMGYIDNLVLMLTGEITTLEPSFDASGGLTLSVRGLNVLHRFRTQQHTYAWENTRDSDIAAEIGDKPVSAEQPGLGLEVGTNPGNEKPDAYVFMNNQYDIVFLMERARRRGYELVLREADEESGRPRHLYFGPSESPDDSTYLLEWGRSLVSFKPVLTTARQVSEVVVLGWDRRKKERIEGKATWQDLLPKNDTAERARMEQLAQAFGSRREVISDRPVHTQDAADQLALDTLRDLRKGLVEASGETIGLPRLRAGRKLQIDGLGERFSGLYYVTETTHTIGGSGYKTTFKARREEGLASS